MRGQSNRLAVETEQELQTLLNFYRNSAADMPTCIAGFVTFLSSLPTSDITNSVWNSLPFWYQRNMFCSKSVSANCWVVCVNDKENNLICVHACVCACARVCVCVCVCVCRYICERRTIETFRKNRIIIDFVLLASNDVKWTSLRVESYKPMWTTLRVVKCMRRKFCPPYGKSSSSVRYNLTQTKF